MPKKEVDAIQKRLFYTIDYLKEHGLSSEEITSLVNESLKIPNKEDVNVPISVFNNDYLSALETIVKFLRENLLLSFKQIASLTNRNEMALAVTYRNARKKMPAKLDVKYSDYFIPVAVLKDRSLSVLENVSYHLKETFGLPYHKIALLLNRDDRTIWTVCQRARRKKSSWQIK